MENRIMELVAMSYNVPAESVNPDTKFADLPIDSVHKVGVISLLEDEYDISLSIRKLDGFVTVGELIDWVKEEA